MRIKAAIVKLLKWTCCSKVILTGIKMDEAKLAEGATLKIFHRADLSGGVRRRQCRPSRQRHVAIAI